MRGACCLLLLAVVLEALMIVVALGWNDEESVSVLFWSGLACAVAAIWLFAIGTWTRLSARGSSATL